jgi:hypothetical protein
MEYILQQMFIYPEGKINYMEQFLLRAGMTMLSLVFAALIRVQNGVYEHLTNITYIT